MANTKSISMQRDGVNPQYLSITDANQTGLDSFSTGLSFECWVKLESFPVSSGHRMRFVDKLGVSDGYYLSIRNVSGSMYFEVIIRGTGGSDTLASTVVVGFSTDTWTHVAMTWEASTKACIFYINGSKLGATATGTNVSAITGSDEPFYLGTNGAITQSYSFDGLMDEVIIWNDVRTSTEISESYNSGDGKIYAGNEANMQGYWRLENDLTDETSNGNDLTNNNSATFSTDVPFTGGGGSPYTLVVDTMAVASTFNAVVLSHARKLVVATMAVATTFNDVILTKTSAGLTLAVDTMAVAATNNVVAFRRTYNAVFDSMTVTSTFNAVNFAWTRAYSLVVATMSVISKFFDVNLKIPGRWVNKTKNTSTWTNSTKNTSTWTNLTKN